MFLYFILYLDLFLPDYAISEGLQTYDTDVKYDTSLNFNGTQKKLN
jgi:hypothetical protein